MIDVLEADHLARMDPTNFALWLNLDPIIDTGDTELLQLALRGFCLPGRDGQRDFYLRHRDAPIGTLSLHAFSLFAHEARHYHDLTLTPYGSMLKRQLARAQLHYLYCRHELLFRSKAIYVPLWKWVSNADLLSTVHPDLSPPTPTIAHLAGLFETMAKKLHMFNQGTYRVHEQQPNATDIIEGLAILCQEGDISQNFGEEALSRFREGMLAREPGRRYYRALEWTCELLKCNAPAEVISYILIASLCGNFQDPDTHRPRYPADVFLSLMKWLSEGGFNPYVLESFDDVVAAVNGYFTARHSTSLEALFAQATQANSAVENALKEMTRDIARARGEDEPDIEMFFEEYTQFQDLQAQLSSRFTEDPLHYCSVLSYLPNQRTLLPPMVFLQCDAGVPVNAEFERAFHVHAETRLHVDEFPSDIRARFAHIADGDVVRGAHVMSLNALAGSSDGNSMFQRGAEQIKLAQKLHDVLNPMRFLLEGPAGGMSPLAAQEVVSAFNMVGTRVFYDASEANAPEVDPRAIRELYADNVIEQLKKVKGRKRGE